MSEKHTTHSLLTSIRRGSNSALTRLLERLRPELLQFAELENNVVLRTKISDSDLVQESLHDVSRSIQGFHGENEEELRLWVQQVFRNNLWNAQRKFFATDKRDVTRERFVSASLSSNEAMTIADDATPLSVRVVKNEEQRIVRSAMLRLSADDQQLLRWRYEDELTVPEIAQRLEKSVPVTKKLLVKALQRLDRELDCDGR